MINSKNTKQIFVESYYGDKKPKWNIVFSKNEGFFTWLNILGMYYGSHNNETGEYTIRYKSKKFVMAAFSLAVQIGLSLGIGTTVVRNMLFNSLEYDERLLYACFLAFPLFQSLSILTFMENKKIVEYLNQWNSFQSLYEKITRTQLIKKSRFMWSLSIWVSLIVGFTTIVARFNEFQTIFTNRNMDKTLHNILVWLFFLAIFVSAAFAFTWYHFNNSVAFAANTLIEEIESLRWKNDKTLEGRISLWLSLWQLCTGVGKILSWTVLYFSVVSFIVVLPGLYIALMTAIKGSYTQIIIAIGSSTFFVSFAEIPQRTRDAVSDNFAARLTKLLVSGQAAGYESELQRFIQTIASCPSYISIGGYYNIDRGLNAPMISTAITYLIILIQFGDTNK